MLVNNNNIICEQSGMLMELLVQLLFKKTN